METLLKSIAPRSLLMIMGGACLLIAAALISYGLWPQFMEYRMSRHTLETLEGAVLNADVLDREIDGIEQEIAVLDENLHGDMLDLPERQMEAYVIGRLQEISWRHSVTLIGVRPGTVTTLISLEEMPFTVEVSGDYFDLYAWLQDLGADLNFLAIRHFNISPVNTVSATPELKASLTLVSYREGANG
jgi:Tfp pilus assembly protein PilO